MNELIKKGQIEGNIYTGFSIDTDGEYGPETQKLGYAVLQRAMHLDYGSNLAIDGLWGVESIETFGDHYVRLGEEQEMVKALQILLLLKGYKIENVDGIFGIETEAAVKEFQMDAGLDVDGIAGGYTFAYLSGAITYFTPDEFRCNCDGFCDHSKLPDPVLVMKADLLRRMIGKPMIINSGVRCYEQNRAVGGVPNSLHMQGKAFDFDLGYSLSDDEIDTFREYAHQCGLDVGYYYANDEHTGFLHCDTSGTGDFNGNA